MPWQLFAGLPVRDFEAARAWYERLLGDPSFLPHAAEAVWMLGDDYAVFVVQDGERAGHGLVTILVDDLDAHVAELASRGLEPAGWETYANGVRKASYRDPEGNEVSFGGVPAG